MKRPCRSRLSSTGSNHGSRGGLLGAERERGDPVRGADRDVHRRRPVDAELDRVGGDPALELRPDLVEYVVPVSVRAERQVLEARELPRHLDVGVVAVRDLQERAVTQRPAAAGLEVASPSRSRAELGRARPEQVEAVRDDLLGPRRELLVTVCYLGFEAGDGGHRGQDRAAQRRNWVGPAERRCELSAADPERSHAEARLTSRAVHEAADAAERRLRACPTPELDALAKPDSQPAGTRPAIQ